jgi:flagellin
MSSISLNNTSFGQDSLAVRNRLLASLTQKLSSGQAINAAADNPAGLAQSTSYKVQLSSQGVALNGLQDGGSLLNTASSALGQVSSNLQQLNDLAVQAGDGSLSASDKQALQDQANQITQNLSQISSSTQFNGQNLLTGSFSGALTTGANPGDTLQFSLGNASPANLGVGALDLTTSNGQANAISAISGALQQVNDQQANVGGLQAGVDAASSALQTGSLSLASANSRISDTNYAQTSSEASLTELQQQASIKALALYQSVQQSSLGFLPKA